MHHQADAAAVSRHSRRRSILAIDGGGIRGSLSLEILAGLEVALAAAAGQPDRRLADQFDLIAGTSVGAITATLLSMGKSVSEIQGFFAATASQMFATAAPWTRIRHKYRSDPLEAQIKALLGAETTLGSPVLRTLMLLVMRNTTTDSPWIVSNNPHAPYNDRRRDNCNLEVPLWQLVRASAAAPSYFAPQQVTLGRERPQTFQFVDGAMTGFNNPAFKAFQYATTEPYGLSWPAGTDCLTVVSVGTGQVRRQNRLLEPAGPNLARLARTVPQELIGAADREQDVLCRTFGHCLVGGVVDREVGDLKTARTAVREKLFNYVRLNASLDEKGLEALGVGVPPSEIESLLAIDATDNLPRLAEIGRAVSRSVDWPLICGALR